MKAKNIIILIVIGVDVLFGLVMLALGWLGGDFAADGVRPHLPIIIGVGTIAGAAITLWRGKEAILGRSVLGFIIYVLVLGGIFFASVYGSLVSAIILLVLAAISSVQAFMELKSAM